MVNSPRSIALDLRKLGIVGLLDDWWGHDKWKNIQYVSRVRVRCNNHHTADMVSAERSEGKEDVFGHEQIVNANVQPSQPPLVQSYPLPVPGSSFYMDQEYPPYPPWRPGKHERDLEQRSICGLVLL